MDLKTLKIMAPWDWPEGSAAAILAVLRDDKADESGRLLAAELAGDSVVINDELAEALLVIISDSAETTELRGVAALSLGPALEHADIMEFDDPEEILISEGTLSRVQRTFHRLFTDPGIPEELQRNILEASVRAPQDWHREAVSAACARDDDNWRLTSIFCMRFVDGFDDSILEALGSDNSDIRYHAICAAGNIEVDAAWPHVSATAATVDADKSLRLAAIEALVCIRPGEAVTILENLADEDDEDIVDAAFEALAMARGLSGEGFGEEEDETPF